MTHAQIKFIQALARQKYRKAHKAYVVEGSKSAQEWLASEAVIYQIAALPEWLSENEQLIGKHPETTILEAAPFELSKISMLIQPQEVLLVAAIPDEEPVPDIRNCWSLYLEQIRDPGNMGTIIRIADWFGIRHLLLSEECVEIYNPKVAQASMGSLLRVNTNRVPVQELASILGKDQPILYATSLHGANLFTIEGKPRPGIIAMGNESSGLSTLLLERANYKISIPKYGGAESLNVGVATGIVCAELIRAAQYNCAS